MMNLISRFFSITLLAVAPNLALCQDQDQPIPVTGLTTGINLVTGERPARKNINDVYSEGGPTWDLYILALSAMQNVSEDDPESYFQVAGIHGRPHIPWNGVGPVNPTQARTGFCPHNEILFAPWHRPYVILYEVIPPLAKFGASITADQQILGRHVGSIASQYVGSNHPSYLAAAQSFRVPYWDWAVDDNLPLASTSEEVTVDGPTGQVTIHNPLYSYRWQKFPLNDSQEYFPNDNLEVTNFTETKRQPNDTGMNQNDKVNAYLGSSNLMVQVYRTFTSVFKFDVMASSSNQGTAFEQPHDYVHNALGAAMEDLNYSGFEPLFMLHHCNVDRLIAMWQAINYNETFQDQPYSSPGQFSVAKGTIITRDSPLKPFYGDTQNFHTGMTAASIKNFGYTYPEIQDWDLSPDEIKDAVTASVNKLYGNVSSTSSRRNHPRSWEQACWKEYYVQIQVERSDLELPCTINLWIGKQNAGQVSILNMPTSGVTHAEMQLNQALEQLNVDLDPGTTVPLIKEQFRVEIQKNDGSIIPVESVPSLCINLQDEDVVRPGSINKFPRHGAPQLHGRIGQTIGRN